MTQINKIHSTDYQSATSESKTKGGRRRVAQAMINGNQVAEALESTSGEKSTATATVPSDILNGGTFGKFVLFGIARADQKKDGPIMRGLVEVKTAGQLPVKVQVAAWLKIGRSSGTEYLSLKVGNNVPEDPEEFTVGPFYGRLFRQVEGTRTRYFGFIEEAEKSGEDANGQATYVTHWQLRVSAKAAVSNDGKTRYITGGIAPSQQHEEEAAEDNALPF